MTRSGSAAELEDRIRQRAHLLWVEEGRPEGREIEYRAKARELIAIEDNQDSATKPRPRGPQAHAPGGQPVEPAVAVENQGEFPGLADQGEESTVPKRPSDRS